MTVAHLDEGCSYHKFLVRPSSVPRLLSERKARSRRAEPRPRCAQDEHLRPNEPCVFPASLVRGWPCLQSFILSDSGPSASVDYAHLLALHEGTPGSTDPRASAGAAPRLAPVHRPSTAAELEEGCPPTVCDERSLAEIFALWKAGDGEDFYVKDWHLALAVEAAGGVPFYDDTWAGHAADDWLNGFYRSKGEDFRFVVRLYTLAPAAKFVLTPCPEHRSISVRPGRRRFSIATSTAASPSQPTSSAASAGTCFRQRPSTTCTATRPIDGASSSRTYVASTSGASRAGRRPRPPASSSSRSRARRFLSPLDGTVSLPLFLQAVAVIDAVQS
jgi:hypothetical protein